MTRSHTQHFVTNRCQLMVSKFFKQAFLFLLVTSPMVKLSGQNDYPNVIIETNKGKLVVMLYDFTPLHSENFVKLVKEGYYNDQLFHRVIKNFMIQTGDPDSKGAAPGVMLGRGGPSYTIPAEFVPQYYHKFGALAAARQGDNINPQRASSGSQFYIVQGQTYTEAELDVFVKRGMHVPFTEDQKQIYTTLGGTPHLDYSYTVFGELIEGFDVLKAIASTPVGPNDRPIEDVRIIKVYTVKK